MPRESDTHTLANISKNVWLDLPEDPFYFVEGSRSEGSRWTVAKECTGKVERGGSLERFQGVAVRVGNGVASFAEGETQPQNLEPSIRKIRRRSSTNKTSLFVFQQ